MTGPATLKIVDDTGEMREFPIVVREVSSLPRHRRPNLQAWLTTDDDDYAVEIAAVLTGHYLDLAVEHVTGDEDDLLDALAKYLVACWKQRREHRP